jgi:CheY-like chemotaxis protein
MADQQPAFLYIEDHPASRMVMQLIVNDVLGYENLTMLEDSRDLLARLDAIGTIFDVIFLDLHVNPLDGYAVYKLLRQQAKFAQTRIIALTASILPDELHSVREAGFDGLIIKPLNPETFLDYVNRILVGESVWEAE